MEDHTAKNRNGGMRDGSFSTRIKKRRESFDEIVGVRGVVERDLPSDVRRQGVSCLDRTVAHGSRG